MAKKKSKYRKNKSKKQVVQSTPTKPVSKEKPIDLTGKKPIWISIALTLIYYLIFQFPAKLNDSCFIGGDTWEYHSMGVNMAYGHGINKFGSFEPIETYLFTFGNDSNVNSFQRIKRDNFRRTPGYPVFLGVVYSIFGVNVVAAKHIQLLLIALIAGFIPLLGRKMNGKNGYLAGVIAGPLIMLSSFRMSELMMTEALTAFALFCTIWAITSFMNAKSIKTGFILGMVMGISLLIKGALIFIPLMLLVILMWDMIRNKSKQLTKSIPAILLGMAIFILPWSLYATSKLEKFTFLSTQSTELLLDSNNEFTQDGSWHPEYRKDKANPQNYFHNQERLSDKSSLQKVITFYSENPSNLIPSLANKFHLGLNPFPYLWILMLGIILEIIRKRIPGFEKNKNLTIPTMLIVCLVALITLLTNSDHQFIPNGNIFGNQLLPKFMTTPMVVLFSVLSLFAFFSREYKFIGIPFTCFLAIMNFIFLTMVFYGSVRFVKVADFAFVFFAVLLPISWLLEWKPSLMKKVKMS